MKKIILLTSFSTLLFLHVAFAQEKDTLKTNSGLKYLILKQGNGQKPWPGRQVSILFSINVLGGEPISSNFNEKPYKEIFNSEHFIAGIVEGIALMTRGARFKFIIPPSLAYGEKGKQDPSDTTKFLIEPSATLVYEIELVDFKK